MNWTKQLTWKLLINVFLSFLLAGVTVLALILLSVFLVEMSTFAQDMFVFIENIFPPELIIIAAGLFSFFFYYYLLMRLTVKRINQVITTVQAIADGNLDYRMKVHSEVDELGKLEQNLNEMAHKLQHSIEEERRAERTKSELITNVSHDLRTPLTSILGYLRLVEEDRYRDEVELRHYIRIAYEKSESLHLMIEDLFEYSRMSGGMNLDMQRVNVAELVSQLFVHYQVPVEECGMTLRMRNAQSPAYVNADTLKLVRVFENLLSNSMKYGRDGRFIDMVVHSDPVEARVEIVNYGEPIPQTDLPHVFERFYRVDKSRTGDRRGSGLGLAISSTMIELHGGRIWAESDAERTRFIISLPRVP
ncbi:HAMP domain-containing histidine kinase [Paenibacillus sp. SC116]|uniref:sensor histidine kinase n=1 Tax=Paenibacillus sp. SC116 TaxID=2968986 RepID=UPI00215B1841|nr:HAMP domain-containing sensor histidine kinase [Paenibacillus sp. SC116]MCR8845044.1 HAMP domain-containing histidine kinase [Paenibacillus sp. SC116]